MGIKCRINLFKPPDSSFQPGETVSGVIIYAVDEPTEFEKITTSLKGFGNLKITHREQNNGRSFFSNEKYVDVDSVILGRKEAVPAGSYEINFSFMLPTNTPPTFEYKKLIPRYRIKCKIKYYIRIKFEKVGWLSFFGKHFRKEINVLTELNPKLITEPIIYGERKKLLQLFPAKPNIINIKVNVFSSIIPIGGVIKLSCEVINDTHLIIKSIQSKLVEVFTFNASGHKEVKAYEEVKDTDSKTRSIRSATTEVIPIEIIVPSNKISINNSHIVSRDYLVRIIAKLPLPHKNVVLNIPVQIGDKLVRAEACGDLPPSYWEAMGETNKLDDIDDEATDDETEGVFSASFEKQCALKNK